MMHFGNFGGMGFGWFGMILPFLFGILLIIGAIYLIQRMVTGKHGPSGQTSAEEVLKRRYAAGEISREEFEERMSVLKAGR